MITRHNQQKHKYLPHHTLSLVAFFTIAFLAFSSIIPYATYANTVEDDRVTMIPGLVGPDGPELHADEVQYAGYVPVGDNENNDAGGKLFYWFFGQRAAPQQNQQQHFTPSTDEKKRAKNRPEDFPLVLWLNGGPGCSSVMGMFEENGPLQVRENATEIYIQRNPHSWNHVAHMLYVDQPIGSGMSYALHDDALVTSQQQVSRHLYTLLQRFLDLHPQYENCDIYLTGESYAGKFLPPLAEHILLQNDQIQAKTGKNSLRRRPLRLKGIALGDALVDPLLQRMVKADQSYWHGLMGHEQRRQVRHLEGNCIRQIQGGLFAEKDSACDELKSQLLLSSGIVNIYDVRRFDPSTNKPRVVQYLNQAAVRRALRIDRDPVQVEYIPCSKDRVYVAMQPDILQSLKHLVPILARRGVRVLLYNGNFDLQDGPVGTEHYLLTLLKSQDSGNGDDDWRRTVPRNLWFVDNAVAGYVQQWHDNITFLTVHAAGHFVPTDQPKNSLHMFQSFLDNTPYCAPGSVIPVQYSALTPNGLHKYLVKDDEGNFFVPCEMAQTICTKFLRNCNGHGTCNGGQCDCDDGYAGAACAYRIEPLQSSHLAKHIVPQQWQYFTLQVGVLAAQHSLSVSVNVASRNLSAVGPSVDPFIGRGIGGPMPARRLCIYGKQRSTSSSSAEELPDFVDFDFVHCFDANSTSTSGFKVDLVHSVTDGSDMWVLGAFNAHPFDLVYDMHASLSDWSWLGWTVALSVSLLSNALLLVALVAMFTVIVCKWRKESNFKSTHMSLNEEESDM